MIELGQCFFYTSLLLNCHFNIQILILIVIAISFRTANPGLFKIGAPYYSIFGGNCTLNNLKIA